MANVFNSANMGLPIPVVGVDPGPDYASNVNAALTLIDSHDHSAGKGVPINPAGININSDLSFGGNNLTLARSIRLQPQVSPLAGAADLGCLYESGVDLYYNDGAGNQVRITQSGGVAGSPGSIANLTSPASASYVAGSSTFVWQSAANTPANMDAASLLIRNLTAGSNAITLQAPNALGSNYNIILPTLPASQKFMTLDASGNMGAPWAVDGSTIVVSSNTVQVPSGGIGTTQLAALSVTNAILAANAVTSSKIADGNVTQAKKQTRAVGSAEGAGGFCISSSSGSFTTASGSFTNVTNLSVTLTVVANPVMVQLISDGTANASFIGSNLYESVIRILVDGTTAIATCDLFASTSSVTLGVPPSALVGVDFSGAGAHTYTVQLKAVSGTASCQFAKLIAYEL